MVNRFKYYDVKKACKQDIKNFIEIGRVEAEKMAVKYCFLHFVGTYVPTLYKTVKQVLDWLMFCVFLH